MEEWTRRHQGSGVPSLVLFDQVHPSVHVRTHARAVFLINARCQQMNMPQMYPNKRMTFNTGSHAESDLSLTCFITKPQFIG